MSSRREKILLVLPMFGQDGHDQYNGIMRVLREGKLDWDVRLDRLAPMRFRPTLEERDTFTGAIINGWAPQELIDSYLRTRIPLVILGWQNPPAHIPTRAGLVHVSLKNDQVGQAAADALLETGHYATFAYLPTENDPPWSVKRGQAFVRRLRKKGITSVSLDPTKSLEPQLRRLPKPAAVFTADDLTAERLLAAAAGVRIPVPEDLSVLGVDNEQFICLHTNPPLASIQPNFELSGVLAAKALADMLAGKRPRRHLMYGIRQVVPRRSMQPARSAGTVVQRALELIHDQDSRSHGISWIAQQLGISRRLLDQRFREIRAKSVLEEILDLKMERVRSLLQTTRLSIAEICAESDLGSGTYPQRAFKKRMGMTMREYRLAQAYGAGISSSRGKSQSSRNAITNEQLHEK